MPGITEAREVQKLELAAEVLGSSGIIRLQVSGTSMVPAIWPGDVVSIERAAANEIVPGDIVLVARDGRFFVHRVIEKRDCLWITRGDSLPQNDPPAAGVQILGRVSRIHGKGGVIVPKLRPSVFDRAFGSLLGHWDLFRNFALRVHSLWSAAAFDMFIALWPLRVQLRGGNASSTSPKVPALHGMR
jgi:signal peptidase I